LRAQLVAIESAAHAVDVGFPEKHRACRCPVVTLKNVSVCTDTTPIAVHARDATAIGSAPTAPTTAPSADPAFARDAKRMLRDGLLLQTVAKTTGVTVEGQSP
jgi:hypothetical protein